MEIKRATKKDARKISFLRRKTLQQVNKNDYPKVFLKFLVNENSTKGILEKLKNREIFCLWEKDALLGTIELKGDKISGLFVKSSKLKKGLGTNLMDFIESYAKSKKIKQLRLYSTKFAINFYKRRGFHLIPSGYWVIGKSKSKDNVLVKKLDS